MEPYYEVQISVSLSDGTNRYSVDLEKRLASASYVKELADKAARQALEAAKA